MCVQKHLKLSASLDGKVLVLWGEKFLSILYKILGLIPSSKNNPNNDNKNMAEQKKPSEGGPR